MENKIKYLLSVLYALLWTAFYKITKYNKKYLKENSDIILVHAPKTAGTSINYSLNLPHSIHCPAYKYKKLKTANLVLFVIRDPFKRIESIFKYSRIKNHKKIISPLFILNYFESIDNFIVSPTFTAFRKYHYFFKPMEYYYNGLDISQKNLKIINFENINETFYKIFKKKLRKDNISPSSDKYSSSFFIESTIAKNILDEAYKKDIEFYENMKIHTVDVDNGNSP